MTLGLEAWRGRLAAVGRMVGAAITRVWTAAVQGMGQVAQGPGGDGWRQGLNVALAVAQVAAIGLSAARGFGDERVNEPPIVPALYTFSVWAVIYTGALVYAAYQARGAQKTDPLLRRVGWWTASAFAATTLWALAQTLGWLWATVACMFWLFASLLGAHRAFWTGPAPTPAQRRLVGAPIGIFLGYITLAALANPASVLYGAGVRDLWGLTETTWAAGLLVLGAGLGAWITRLGRGSAPYALTLCWGLGGVLAQNALSEPNAVVAAAAALGMVVVLGTLAWARRGEPAPA